jgi:alpha-amylase
MGTRDVGIQLFEWNWDSIARECTDHLGPAGISWVLTSPPQEHIEGTQWWTNYQPVSYRIESRLGNREEFAAMVETCTTAGVDIIGMP